MPPKAHEVQVIGVSNIGMGGILENVKPFLPSFIKDFAEQAAKVLELPVCGVDFMVTRFPKPNLSLEDLQPKVIEVNSCPSLPMYDDLHSPEQQVVIDTYLDYLAEH